jgi:hypothetical protein
MPKERSGGPTPHITIRRRPEDDVILDALMRRLGIGQSAVIRLALWRLAQAEGVELPDGSPEGKAAA